MRHFLTLVPMLLVTVLKISLSKVNVAFPCWGSCRKLNGTLWKGSKTYYKCNVIGISGSDIYLGLVRMIYDIDLRFDNFDNNEYWQAKAYQSHYPALWKPGYYDDLFCPDEGYGWDVSKSQDGSSVSMKTIRPGYRDYYFIGPKHYDANQLFSRRHNYKNFRRLDKNKNVTKTNPSNMASAIDDSKLPEKFAFRIICHNCGSTNNCSLQRAYDETKKLSKSKDLYTSPFSNPDKDPGTKGLDLCQACGSEDWLTMRVYSPNVTLNCPVASRSSSTIITQSTVSIVFCLILYYFN